MNSTVPSTSAFTSGRPPRSLTLRASCWVVALTLGAVQSWTSRFTMNPDGISYLDIGDAYWRHDWHNAINAYWSPLYSWILGFFINVIKPSPYWEYPLVHLVNLAIYFVTLGSFEFLLTTIVSKVHQRTSHTERILIQEPELRLLGYSIFLSSALVLIGLNTVTPDLLTAAFIFLAAALALRVRSADSKKKPTLALGLVLGFGY